MGKLIELLRRMINFLYKALNVYSEVVLLAIVIMVSVQVILRKFFAISIIWVEEVSLLLVAWTAFIALAIGVGENSHISINLLYDKLPKPVQSILDVLNHLILIIVGGCLIVNGVRLIGSTMNSTLPITKLPSAVTYFMIPVSGAYVIYFSLLKIYHILKKKKDIEYERKEKK